MFTGIVQTTGTIAAVDVLGGDKRLTVQPGALDPGAIRPGDSIAVNGVCLTAIDPGDDGFVADVSRETLAVTTLGSLVVGDRVNLEPAMTLAQPLGGHLVSGHIDGIGVLSSIHEDARSTRMAFVVPDGLARYLARKGSVCVDGVSLTVNGVADSTFSVNIVPHTLENTIMGQYRVGTGVNVEVDLLARYLERLMEWRD